MCEREFKPKKAHVEAIILTFFTLDIQIELVVKKAYNGGFDPLMYNMLDFISLFDGSTY